jgi:hypothetical protein
VRAARVFRRLFFLLICALLAAAAFGLLGAKSGEVRASGGGYDLQVVYPKVTRPGLPATLDVSVHRAGGFRGSVTLAVTSRYLEIFDIGSVNPDAIGATSTADRFLHMFQAPVGSDTMTISFDARTQPGVQLKRVKGTLALVDDGATLVSVQVKTVVMP